MGLVAVPTPGMFILAWHPIDHPAPRGRGSKIPEAPLIRYRMPAYPSVGGGLVRPLTVAKKWLLAEQATLVEVCPACRRQDRGGAWQSGVRSNP
jgi:hypothetical protein